MTDQESMDAPHEPTRKITAGAVAAMRAGQPDGARRAEKMLHATGLPPEDFDTSWDEIESYVNFELSWLAASVSAGYVARSVELACELHERSLGPSHVGMTAGELARAVTVTLDWLTDNLADPAAEGENLWLLMEDVHAVYKAGVAIPGLADRRDTSRRKVRKHLDRLLSEARDGNAESAGELWTRVTLHGESAGVSPSSLGITDAEWQAFALAERAA